ncbi:MAG: nickel pincer cofactor biosynthesis protein LarC [Bacillota bacterium]|nr:nickel pincer cofactor biosynthesis protein LarC [Bacillota bacterium]
MKKTPSEEKQILYFDCFSGVSGDMILGAALDLGLGLSDLREVLGSLALSGWRLESKRVSLGGIAGTRVIVHVDEDQPPQRNLPAIMALLREADLPDAIYKQSTAVFKRLAEAESAVHNIPVEKVHFHEVGAVDAIIDVVGAAAVIYLLNIDEIYCSPLPAGRGTVKASHGILPLPAPATLEILAGRGVPVEGRENDFEMVTPTGAAVVATFARSFGPLPSFTVEAVGYGAGSYDPGFPNFLRLIKGRCLAISTFEENVDVIEANIDDLNPEVFGYLMERLLAAGALDVYFTPIQMKKNRPAIKLTVLGPPAQRQKLQVIIFAETTTLGLRLTTARKIMLPRETKVVESQWGPITIKYSSGGEGSPISHLAPEYEDCRKIASLSGLPLLEVYHLAEHLFNSSVRGK